MHVRIVLTTGEVKWVWSYRLAPVCVTLTDEWEQSTPIKEGGLGAVVDYLFEKYDLVSLYIMEGRNTRFWA